MLRVGSNLNYTYESIYLLLLNGILFIEHLDIKIAKKHIYIYAFYLILLPFNYYLYFYSKTEQHHLKTTFMNNMQSAESIRKIVQKQTLFIPNMKYLIFYPDCNLVYGYDWHYERFTDLYYDVKLTPKFLENEIVKKYDAAFENGSVQYILMENNDKSKKQMQDYYANFTPAKNIDSFILYKYASPEKKIK